MSNYAYAIRRNDQVIALGKCSSWEVCIATAIIQLIHHANVFCEEPTIVKETKHIREYRCSNDPSVTITVTQLT